MDQNNIKQIRLNEVLEQQVRTTANCTVNPWYDRVRTNSIQRLVSLIVYTCTNVKLKIV